MQELSEIKEVLLVYRNTKTITDKLTNSKKEKITYTIICDGGNIVENLEVLKKIVAMLEFRKLEEERNGKIFDYTIQSIKKFGQLLDSDDKKTISELSKSTLLYAKNSSYSELVNKTR